MLKDGERIDDLQLKGLKIIQNENGFCFGIDAVLLANSLKIKNNSTVVDLGTGTGIIPVLIAGKSKTKKIFGVEIQKDVADMAIRTIRMNHLEQRIEIINRDLKDIAGSVIEKNSVDTVVSNPPYMHSNGVINENDKKAISRHEISCTIEDIIKVAYDLLKPMGRFFMINRTLRLSDIMYYSRVYRLEVKTMRFIHSKVGKAPKLVIVEMVKNAKPESKVLPPLYIYEEDGKYTREVLDMYSKEEL